MSLNFNQYAVEGNTFIKKYAKDMNLEHDIDKAGRVLSSVLFGLRELISFEESLQLIAQLPMFLKAIYVNGWSAKKKKMKIKHMYDFIQLVRSYDNPTAIYDFESDEIAEHYINTTFFTLRKYISPGEMDDIRNGLPKNLKNMIYQNISEQSNKS
ncbi:DUF2267 domain-containing protein [Aquimarina algicola]|uniref:DUF2267 domain-containing protein n=1 Tax=Aquimarina algicola TaxID=2589995 RepID=A0A504IY27_9FLAO|nr:DUF2267 domain-containing protein [Aquimarina algicola]TPN83377.1 DUF2267 domain-containing protein [Aquimarina algicola]